MTMRKQARERDRLLAELATRPHVWVELERTGISPPQLNALAAQHGASVTRVLGQQPAAVALLSKGSVTSIRDTVAGTGNRRSSRTRYWAGAGLSTAAVLVMLLAIGLAVLGNVGLGAVVLLVVGGFPLFIAALVAGTSLQVGTVRGSTTVRMNRLIAEFDGADEVILYAPHYRFDLSVYVALGQELGYTLAHVRRRPLVRAEWNLTWLTFRHGHGPADQARSIQGRQPWQS